MRTPRDITAKDLIKVLKPFGYEVIRQKRSHIRIKTEINGVHQETIPNHQPIKIGTLNAILNNIAEHFDMTREELIEQLF
jgi:predicted RNA binding protein YcfA (HicA-like mRNA interferase family)